ncbi:hypothetical protein Tco_0912891 [Tanacetum coccineum]
MCNIGNTVTTGQESQEIPTPAIFQTDDLDAFDSDCDEAPSTSAVLMAKLPAYDSNVLSEVPNHDTYLDNHMIDQNVQEMQYSEQPPFINDPDIDITNDSNVILYEQYLKETGNEVVQDTPSSTQQDATIMSVIEEMSNQVAKSQRKVPALYCGQTIVKKHDALSVMDTEETLILAEESRLKMHAKQNNPIAKDKKVNIAPIDYAALNKLSEHFVKHFLPQKQLSTEQAFWLPILKPVSETPPEPVLKEIPCELPTISLVKDSFNKMRSHVNKFDEVITVCTKVTGQNEGT